MHPFVTAVDSVVELVGRPEVTARWEAPARSRSGASEGWPDTSQQIGGALGIAAGSWRH